MRRVANPPATAPAFGDAMTTGSGDRKAHRPTPRMRSLFRETARSIIARDRFAQSKGLSQNTIGEIERAMAKAYVLGQEALIDDQRSLKSSARINWLDVPPRARDTLRSMTWAFSKPVASRRGRGNKVFDARADEIEIVEPSGRKRWAVVINGKASERTIADGSVAPLLRLGIIQPLPDNPMRHALTEAGLTLCQDYWLRSDANDPTLPIQSVRK